MKLGKGMVVAALVIGGLQLSACQQRPASATGGDKHPAVVEKINGTGTARVTLSEQAIKRIDLKTGEVREEMISRSKSKQKVVPYSALIYDVKGSTWVYTSPQPRTFVRQKVEVDYIEGDVAVLKDGPPAGTVVASVGVAELFGAEFRVGH